MGMIKYRNGRGSRRELEEVQEWTKQLYKKGLNDPENHGGVVTHLEPHILKCDVKRALGSITQTKLGRVIEFQVSYVKS